MIWQGPREVLCALLGEAPIVPFVPRPRHLTTLEECAAKASSRRTRRDENRWKYCHGSRARGCRSGSGAGCIVGFAAEGAGSSHQCGGQGRRSRGEGGGDGSCDARRRRSSGGGGGGGIEIAGDGTVARPDDAATYTACTGSVGGQNGAATSTTCSTVVPETSAIVSALVVWPPSCPRSSSPWRIIAACRFMYLRDL